MSAGLESPAHKRGRKGTGLISTVRSRDKGLSRKREALDCRAAFGDSTMKMMKLFSCAALVLALPLTVFIGVRAAEEPVRREWTVDGLAREALVSAPASAKSKAAPLVFVWHGHGGNMNQVMHASPIHTLWPEAIVVYPQGLKTPGRLTDPEGKKNGWQHGVGAQGDRDLKFFDVILASLKQDYKVDEKRIFSTGHSNGGGFTYLLWAERGATFAAFAPSSAPTTPAQFAKLKPKPVLHIAGENDTLVKFEWQKMTINAVRKLNQCDAGQPWDKVEFCAIYVSKIGAPVVTFIHPGTHTFHKAAPAAIVKFFKEIVKP